MYLFLVTQDTTAVSRMSVCTITHNTLHFDRLLPGNWHCAASRKVAGSITDGVIGIFH